MKTKLIKMKVLFLTLFPDNILKRASVIIPALSGFYWKVEKLMGKD